MKIRLISDLHLDINESYDLKLSKRKSVDYTLIAGDICADQAWTIDWLKNNVVNGAFISGNHDAYTHDHKVLDDVKKDYAKEFPVDADITYFDNDVGVISKKLSDKVLLVADVLYTDYKLKIPYLNESGNQDVNMRFACRQHMSDSGMNDFVYGRTYQCTYKKSDFSDLPEDVWNLRPQCYLDHFNAAFKNIDKVISDNPDMDVILMTHHAISPKALDKNYVEDKMSASYASDLEDWVKSKKNIKLVFSGHIHTHKLFNVGDAKYVVNALGYANHQFKKYDEESKTWKFWTPECIVDTNTWNVNFSSIVNKKWLKIYDEANSRFMQYAGLFI